MELLIAAEVPELSSFPSDTFLESGDLLENNTEVKAVILSWTISKINICHSHFYSVSKNGNKYLRL